MVLFPVGFLLELTVIFSKCSVLLSALMGHLKGRLSNCISLIWIFRIDSMSNKLKKSMCAALVLFFKGGAVSSKELWQGAKEVTFTACHSDKLKLTFSSPNIISTSPKNVLMSRLISQFLCNLDSSKNFTCPSGKLITEFTSPIAKPTSRGLLDTTFFACCTVTLFLSI